MKYIDYKDHVFECLSNEFTTINNPNSGTLSEFKCTNCNLIIWINNDIEDNYYYLSYFAAYYDYSKYDVIYTTCAEQIIKNIIE
jgi:hypothetical protein